MKYFIFIVIVASSLFSDVINSDFTYLSNSYKNSLNGFFIGVGQSKSTLKLDVNERLDLGELIEEEPIYVNSLINNVSTKSDIDYLRLGYESGRLRSYLELSHSKNKQLKIYGLMFNYFYANYHKLDLFLGTGFSRVSFHLDDLQKTDENISVNNMKFTSYKIPITLGIKFKISDYLSISLSSSYSQLIRSSEQHAQLIVDESNSTLHSRVFLKSLRELMLTIDYKF